MQLRTSDSVKIISEAGNASFDMPCAQWADVTVAQELRGGELDVRVTANHARLKYLRLRWNFSSAEKRAATVRNAARTDTLEPLDWMENVCPERRLHGGEEIRFNWYPAEGTESFQP